MAQSIAADDYMEYCAKTRWNVKEVFKSAAVAILHKDEEKAPEDTNKSQSVLRRFSWFHRKSSGSDLTDSVQHSCSLSVRWSETFPVFNKLTNGEALDLKVLKHCSSRLGRLLFP